MHVDHSRARGRVVRLEWQPDESSLGYLCPRIRNPTMFSDRAASSWRPTFDGLPENVSQPWATIDIRQAKKGLDGSSSTNRAGVQGWHTHLGLDRTTGVQVGRADMIGRGPATRHAGLESRKGDGPGCSQHDSPTQYSIVSTKRSPAAARLRGHTL